MANALGFSYGDVVANAESIKTARAQRERQKVALERDKVALETDRFNLDQARDEVGNRRKDRANMLALRGAAATGDRGAMRALTVVDPNAASQFMDALGQMDEGQIEAQREGVEFMGRAAAFVLSSDDPAAAYADLYNSVPDEVRQTLPDQYDENFVRLQVARAAEYSDLMDDYFAQQKEKRGEAKDKRADRREFEYDVKLEEAKAAIKGGAKGGARQPKAADSNTIIRAAAPFFDGIIDQDGTVRLTDPAQGAKYNELVAEASNIWANGTMPHAEAVKQAADKLGYGRQSPTGTDTDPLGLRGG